MSTDSQPNIEVLRTALVKEFYEASISSKAAFAGLQEHITEDDERRAGRLLEEVEVAKLEALSSLIVRHRIQSDEEAARVRGAGWGAAYASVGDWQEFWEGFIPATEPWLGGMQFLQAICSDADRAAIDQLVAHEEAILEFARRAATGSTDSLHPLEQSLAVYQ